MSPPCSVAALGNSPKINHHLPQRPSSASEKKDRSVGLGPLEFLSVLCSVQVQVSGKTAHCVPVWTIHHLANSTVVNKVSWDKMCQKCCLSSWDFVIAHISKLFTIRVFSYLWLIKLWRVVAYFVFISSALCNFLVTLLVPIFSVYKFF